MAVTHDTFDPHEYLSKGGFGKTLLQARKNEGIFAQGDLGDTVYYIQKGKVKLTVVSPTGKEATIAILGAGHFVGEECITSDQPNRTCSCKALTPVLLLRAYERQRDWYAISDRGRRNVPAVYQVSALAAIRASRRT